MIHNNVRSDQDGKRPTQRKKGSNEMIDNPWERTKHEVLDDAQYAYTKGCSTLQALDGLISVIAHEGRPLTPADLDHIHKSLPEVSNQLAMLYLWLVDSAFEGEAVLPERLYPTGYDDRYLDGSPVWTVQAADVTRYQAGATSCREFLAGPDLHPGTEAIVAVPPHRRLAGPAKQ